MASTSQTHTSQLDAAAESQLGLPLVIELTPAPDPEAAFLRLAERQHCLFLDSARRDPQLGRYSFLMAEPWEFLERPAVANQDALADLAARIEPFTAPTVPGLPPFQGGAAGLLSYDLNVQLEKLEPPRIDEFKLPGLAVGFYDIVLCFDHELGRAWLISHGFPETEPQRRKQRAQSRADEFRHWLTEPTSGILPTSGERALERHELAPQFQSHVMRDLTSNFSRADYLERAEQAIEYVRAGDVFQVNLAQRLLYPAHDHAIELYLRLRRRNPATFAAYFDLGQHQLASASPERFIAVRQRQAETRPIKGTRSRPLSPEADLYSGDELRASEKDRAENVMIVDLLRNDLSRACTAASVRVRELCRLETYQYVQHLVSVVSGTLRDDHTALDLVRAAFPGGSITGAPKVRAMQIIQELEPTARGAYCGTLGYFGFDGTSDTSILIRTITASRGWWQAPVGGGIVAQSLPEREYAETWHKAEGMLRALV